MDHHDENLPDKDFILDQLNDRRLDELAAVCAEEGLEWDEYVGAPFLIDGRYETVYHVSLELLNDQFDEWES